MPTFHDNAPEEGGMQLILDESLTEVAQAGIKMLLPDTDYSEDGPNDNVFINGSDKDRDTLKQILFGYGFTEVSPT